MLICKGCKNTFTVKNYNKNRAKYCSRECSKKHNNTNINCVVCAKEFTVKNSHLNKGRKCCSKKCQSINFKTILKKDNNPNWKGGISTENQLLRTNERYQKWRVSVFIRDNRQCQKCGSKKEIQAHHIKMWSKFKEFRYDINNGITLCYTCHKEVHRTKDPNYLHL